MQLLILYHLVTAKAAVALGSNGSRNAESVTMPALPDEPRAVAVE